MKNGHKTLILGLGNPILSDDGVGWHVAAALKERLNEPHVDVLEASIAGLDFLDLLAPYDKTIIVDSIQTAGGIPGQIHHFGPEILASTRHAGTPHDVNLATALELGRKLNLPLPGEITFYAIEASDVTSFSEECTSEVMKAVPACADMIIRELSAG
jgi:hydrogenase maturation protease